MGDRALGLLDAVIHLVRLVDSDPEPALWDLRDVIGAAFGDDGRIVGAAFREAGGVGKLVKLLVRWNRLGPSESHLPHIWALRQLALEVLGNLSSDAVDADSLVTKRALLDAGGDFPLLACLQVSDVNVVRLAVATMQNLAQDPAWCQVLGAAHVYRTLEELVAHSDAIIVRYASGTLRNMQLASELAGLPPPKLSQAALRTLEQRQRDAAVEAFRMKRAKRVIKAGLKRYKGSKSHRKRQLEAKRAALEAALESQTKIEAAAEAKQKAKKEAKNSSSRSPLPTTSPRARSAGEAAKQLADFLRSPEVDAADAYDLLIAEDVKSVNDLALLSEADLAELGLRLGVRKRIRAALVAAVEEAEEEDGLTAPAVAIRPPPSPQLQTRRSPPRAALPRVHAAPARESNEV